VEREREKRETRSVFLSAVSTRSNESRAEEQGNEQEEGIMDERSSPLLELGRLKQMLVKCAKLIDLPRNASLLLIDETVLVLGKEADRRGEKAVCTGVKPRVRQKSETVGEKKKKKKKSRRVKRCRQGKRKGIQVQPKG